MNQSHHHWCWWYLQISVCKNLTETNHWSFTHRDALDAEDGEQEAVGVSVRLLVQQPAPDVVHFLKEEANFLVLKNRPAGPHVTSRPPRLFAWCDTHLFCAVCVEIHAEAHPGVGLLQSCDVSHRAGHLPRDVVDDDGVAQVWVRHRVAILREKRFL